MEQRQDDLGDDSLPRPGTEEPEGGEGTASGDAGGGPGNVSVDEPTAGALGDAGTPGGDDGETSTSDDDDADQSDDTSEDTSEDTSDQ